MSVEPQLTAPDSSHRPSPTEPPAAKAADETLEDYTLRFAPRSYRRWTPMVVATTALGGIAYMADFSIGAGIGLAHGTGNALAAILVAAVVIFLTGFPLAYYAARYNIDLDLITRGSGFGYYGSVLTSVIFASFTFIFFALEGSIMAQGLKLGFGLPLWLGYVISTCMVIPLVVYGMKALSKLQVWTTPIWLLLMVGPLLYLVATDPGTVHTFLSYPGSHGHGGVDAASVLLGAGVCLSLIAQIGEQVDYLRFMPPKTAQNRRSWWTAVVMAKPRMGRSRRAQAGHRRLPGRLRPLPGRRGLGHRAHPAVHRRLRRHDAVVAGRPAGRGAGRDQPDQDQRDQCLLRFAGLD